MEAELVQEGLRVILGNGGGKRDKPLLANECKGRLPGIEQCWIPVVPTRQGFCVHYAYQLSDEYPPPEGAAGVFCELYIDGEVVERAYLPIDVEDDENQEWEITGKFFRGEQGEPDQERPFRFALRDIEPDAPIMSEDGGTIRVVLYWARPNPNIPNPYPIPDKKLAHILSKRLRQPVTKAESGRHMCCVKFGSPVDTGVVENNMQVEPVNDRRHTFIFRYAHPEWLAAQRVPRPERSDDPKRYETPSINYLGYYKSSKKQSSTGS